MSSMTTSEVAATSSVVSDDSEGDHYHMDVTMLDDDETVAGSNYTVSATSHQEASQVLEEWKRDHELMMQDTMMMISSIGTVVAKPALGERGSNTVSDDSCDESNTAPEDMAILMEVDEEIGSNFMKDDVFGGGGPCCVPCVPSPCGPVDEFHACFPQPTYYYRYDYDDSDERSLAPFLDEEGQDAVVMALDSVLEGESISSEPNCDPEQYRKLLEKLVESMKKSEETRKSLTMKTPKTEKYGRSKTVTGVLTSIEKSSKQLQNYLKTVQKAVG